MKKIIVESFEPIRLDRYIRRVFPSATQGLIERYLRNGKIKVNAEKVKSNNRLKNGDEITLFADLFQDSPGIKKFSEGSISLATKLLNEYLLLSTNEFIAINKPSGLAVQGGTKINLSVDDAISYLNIINKTSFKLVHRLDRATSGVLLIARGANNAAKLGQAFKDKLIQKTYYAVVCGHPQEEQGVIYNFIGKDKSGIFEIVKELEDGKRAETSYRILNKNNDYSLIEFKPATGRMHQLRVHSKILGCPILGDIKYGGSSCRRMMLHAKKIVIPQEIFGNETVIETDLPETWFIIK